MKRIILFLMVFLFVRITLADSLPNSGKKFVQQDFQIETDKDFSDYSFYTVYSSHCAGFFEFELSPDKPVSIKKYSGDVYGVTLIAVPKKNLQIPGTPYQDTAICQGEIPGAVDNKYGFSFTTEIPISDPRNTIITRYRLDDISPEKGLVLNKLGDTPPSRMMSGRFPLLIGGAALSLVIICLGVWRFNKYAGKSRI